MWLVTLAKICLLHAKPQDLPTATVLVLFAVLGYFAAGVASASAMAPLASALQAAALDTLVLLALTQTALNLQRKGVRLRQTVLALVGSGTLITVVAMTAASLLRGIFVEETATMVVWTLSIIWMFAIYGHILRHAFDVSYATGIFAAGAYFFISLLVTAPFLLSPDVNH